MNFVKKWLRNRKIQAPKNAEAWRIETNSIDIEEVKENVSKELGGFYLDPWEYEDLFEAAGLEGVLKRLREKDFPKDERTKKGNFGETVTTMWVRDELGYEVPFMKRRWAMNRERSQLGEDVVGFKFSDNGKDQLLLVESKFYLEQVPSAIKRAYETIKKCLTSNQCYTLKAIITLFHERGDRRHYDKVKQMFDHYTGETFIKEGGIFITTKSSAWKDSYFVEKLGENEIKGLNCWAFVSEEIKQLYEDCH